MTRPGPGPAISCPSSLRVARWEAGLADTAEEHQQTTAHLRGCSHCAAVVGDISQARSDLFSHPSTSPVLAARKIADAVANRRQQRRRRWFRFPPMTAAPILLGAAALWLVVPHLPGGDVNTVPAQAIDRGVRAKGGLVMEAYCKRKDAVFAVDDGAPFFAGDRLRFAYTMPVAGYLMIFGVNDDGKIFPYYSDGRLVGIPVAAGARHILPGSVELDGHRGLERVFALWSDKPINGEPVRKAVAGALASVGDIGLVAQLPVPAAQVSYLLRRP
jgi:hypothetical protein